MSRRTAAEDPVQRLRRLRKQLNSAPADEERALPPMIRPHKRSQVKRSPIDYSNEADTSCQTLKAPRPVMVRAARKAAELAAEIDAVRTNRAAASSSLAGLVEAQDILRRSKVKKSRPPKLDKSNRARERRPLHVPNPHRGATLGELSLPALNVRTEALAAIDRAKDELQCGKRVQIRRSKSAGASLGDNSGLIATGPPPRRATSVQALRRLADPRSSKAQHQSRWRSPQNDSKRAVCTSCPNGHGLRALTMRTKGLCDGCAATVANGMEVMDCSICNWILCTECTPIVEDVRTRAHRKQSEREYAARGLSESNGTRQTIFSGLRAAAAAAQPVTIPNVSKATESAKGKHRKNGSKKHNLPRGSHKQLGHFSAERVPPLNIAAITSWNRYRHGHADRDSASSAESAAEQVANEYIEYDSVLVEDGGQIPSVFHDGHIKTMPTATSCDQNEDATSMTDEVELLQLAREETQRLEMELAALNNRDGGVEFDRHSDLAHLQSAECPDVESFRAGVEAQVNAGRIIDGMGEQIIYDYGGLFPQ